MTPEVFAEWFRRQGQHVVKTASSYWHSQGPGVYQAFPHHWVIEPEPGEVRGMFRATRAIALRYSTPVEAAEGALSYHAVYDHPAYGLERLSPAIRRDVRRALRRCVVEPISFARLAAEGLALELDTLDRQGRSPRYAEAAWRQRCLAAAELPGFEAWAALVDGGLAATATVFHLEGWCCVLSQQSLRRHLRDNVNAALAFSLTRAAVDRPGFRGVMYGLHSLDAPPTVDAFKFRMGYRARAVRQRVCFHPAVGWAVTRGLHAALRGARRLRPRDVTLAKTEGMVRFHLQGRLPLERQPVPAGLGA